MIEARLRRAVGKLNGAEANGSSALSSCDWCGVDVTTDGGDSCGGNGGGAMVGAGELNIVEVVDDGEDNVTGVVGVAGIEGTSDSFNTVTGRKKIINFISEDLASIV